MFIIFIIIQHKNHKSGQILHTGPLNLVIDVSEVKSQPKVRAFTSFVVQAGRWNIGGRAGEGAGLKILVSSQSGVE